MSHIKANGENPTPQDRATSDPEGEGVRWIKCERYPEHRDFHRRDPLNGWRWRCYACDPEAVQP
jgi:hypothetical protein